MAFKIVKDAASWWPIRWSGVDDDGNVVEQSIEVRFVRMGVAEFMAMFGPDNTTENAAMWARTVRGWRGVEDESGVELPMTDEAVDALLDTANFPEALGKGYVTFFRAIAETRLGNFLPSLAGGPAAADQIDAPEVTPRPSGAHSRRPGPAKRR